MNDSLHNDLEHTDLTELGHDMTGIPTTEESWCRKCGEESHIIKRQNLRCPFKTLNKEITEEIKSTLFIIFYKYKDNPKELAHSIKWALKIGEKIR